MFTNSLGTQTLIEEPIFPLLSYNPETNIWKCVGTGFFIQGLGVFVTAKHVFYENDGKALPTLYGVQTTSSNERHLRPVKYVQPHPNADICIGILGERRLPGGGNCPAETATSFTISTQRIDNGSNVRTYAFPLTEREILNNTQFEFTFKGKWAAGEIVDFHKDGSPMVRNGCYQTTMDIKHGASGGPVLKNDIVIGVNSSGMEVMDGETPISFVTPIDLILDLTVPDGNGSITIRELIKRDYIGAK